MRGSGFDDDLIIFKGTQAVLQATFVFCFELVLTPRTHTYTITAFQHHDSTTTQF